MTALLVGSMATAFGGLPIGLAATLATVVLRRVRRSRGMTTIRPTLLLVLIELRAGRSVLSALELAASSRPDEHELSRIARVASVKGLPVAAGHASGPLGRLVEQLARCQRSGASAAATVRNMLDADIVRERTRRIEKARSLPVRMMVPLTLLVLPGLILVLYAPALLKLWHQMSAPFS